MSAAEGTASHLNDEGFCGRTPGVEELWGHITLGATVIVKHRACHLQCPAEVNCPMPIQVIFPSHVLDSWTNTHARERIIRTSQGCSFFHSVLCHKQMRVTIIPHQCCPSHRAFFSRSCSMFKQWLLPALLQIKHFAAAKYLQHIPALHLHSALLVAETQPMSASVLLAIKMWDSHSTAFTHYLVHQIFYSERRCVRNTVFYEGKHHQTDLS